MVSSNWANYFKWALPKGIFKTSYKNALIKSFNKIQSSCWQFQIFLKDMKNLT